MYHQSINRTIISQNERSEFKNLELTIKYRMHLLVELAKEALWVKVDQVNAWHFKIESVQSARLI